jgi:hypothetical protein
MTSAAHYCYTHTLGFEIKITGKRCRRSPTTTPWLCDATHSGCEMGFFFVSSIYFFGLLLLLGRGSWTTVIRAAFCLPWVPELQTVCVCVQFANPKHELASATKIPDGNCAKLFESFRHSETIHSRFPAVLIFQKLNIYSISNQRIKLNLFKKKK